MSSERYCVQKWRFSTGLYPELSSLTTRLLESAAKLQPVPQSERTVCYCRDFWNGLNTASSWRHQAQQVGPALGAGPATGPSRARYWIFEFIWSEALRALGAIFCVGVRVCAKHSWYWVWPSGKKLIALNMHISFLDVVNLPWDVTCGLGRSDLYGGQSCSSLARSPAGNLNGASFCYVVWMQHLSTYQKPRCSCLYTFVSARVGGYTTQFLHIFWLLIRNQHRDPYEQTSFDNWSFAYSEGAAWSSGRLAAAPVISFLQRAWTWKRLK